MAALWENADSLAGDEVTVSSEVQRFLSDRAFVLGGTEGGEPLLVVHDGAVEILSQTSYRGDRRLHQALDVDEVVDLADEPLRNTIYETYGEDPYLEATRIELIEGMGAEPPTHPHDVTAT